MLKDATGLWPVYNAARILRARFMLVEFLLEQYLLVGAGLTVLAILLRYESSKAGASCGVSELSMLVNKEDGIVLDIRDGNDFKNGHIVESKHIPYRELVQRVAELNEYKDKPVVVVCKMGQTASPASKQLRAAGFSRVYKLTGGISEWQAASLPLVKK